MTQRMCKNCRFMVPHVDDAAGFCHFPPIQAVGPNAGTWAPVCIKDQTLKDPAGNPYPVYAADSWCASFKPRRRWWQFWKKA